jgi:hypothetical protein
MMRHDWVVDLRVTFLNVGDPDWVEDFRDPRRSSRPEMDWYTPLVLPGNVVRLAEMDLCLHPGTETSAEVPGDAISSTLRTTCTLPGPAHRPDWIDLSFLYDETAPLPRRLSSHWLQWAGCWQLLALTVSGDTGSDTATHVLVQGRMRDLETGQVLPEPPEKHNAEHTLARQENPARVILQNVILPHIEFDERPFAQAIERVMSRVKGSAEDEAPGWVVISRAASAEDDKDGPDGQPDQDKNEHPAQAGKDEGFDLADEFKVRTPWRPLAQRTITMNMDNIPAGEVVRYFSMGVGAKFRIYPNRVVFADRGVPLEPLETRFYDFAGVFPPFGQSLSDGAAIIQFFRGFGVTFPDGSNVFFVPETKRLAAWTTPEDHRKLRRILTGGCVMPTQNLCRWAVLESSADTEPADLFPPPGMPFLDLLRGILNRTALPEGVRRVASGETLSYNAGPQRAVLRGGTAGGTALAFEAAAQTQADGYTTALEWHLTHDGQLIAATSTFWDGEPRLVACGRSSSGNQRFLVLCPTRLYPAGRCIRSFDRDRPEKKTPAPGALPDVRIRRLRLSVTTCEQAVDQINTALAACGHGDVALRWTVPQPAAPPPNHDDLRDLEELFGDTADKETPGVPPPNDNDLKDLEEAPRVPHPPPEPAAAILPHIETGPLELELAGVSLAEVLGILRFAYGVDWAVDQEGIHIGLPASLQPWFQDRYGFPVTPEALGFSRPDQGNDDAHDTFFALDPIPRLQDTAMGDDDDDDDDDDAPGTRRIDWSSMKPIPVADRVRRLTGAELATGARCSLYGRYHKLDADCSWRDGERIGLFYEACSDRTEPVLSLTFEHAGKREGYTVPVRTGTSLRLSCPFGPRAASDQSSPVLAFDVAPLTTGIGFSVSCRAVQDEGGAATAGFHSSAIVPFPGSAPLTVPSAFGTCTVSAETANPAGFPVDTWGTKALEADQRRRQENPLRRLAGGAMIPEFPLAEDDLAAAVARLCRAWNEVQPGVPTGHVVVRPADRTRKPVAAGTETLRNVTAVEVLNRIERRYAVPVIFTENAVLVGDGPVPEFRMLRFPVPPQRLLSDAQPGMKKEAFEQRVRDDLMRSGIVFGRDDNIAYIPSSDAFYGHGRAAFDSLYARGRSTFCRQVLDYAERHAKAPEEP